MTPLFFLMALFVAGTALSQDATQSSEFEVASVKLAAAQTGGGTFVGVRGGPGTPDATRIAYVNESLRNLLTEAYDVRAYQVSGPDWIDTERYDITAKTAERRHEESGSGDAAESTGGPV